MSLISVGQSPGTQQIGFYKNQTDLGTTGESELQNEKPSFGFEKLLNNIQFFGQPSPSGETPNQFVNHQFATDKFQPDNVISVSGVLRTIPDSDSEEIDTTGIDLPNSALSEPEYRTLLTDFAAQESEPMVAAQPLPYQVAVDEPTPYPATILHRPSFYKIDFAAPPTVQTTHDVARPTPSVNVVHQALPVGSTPIINPVLESPQAVPTDFLDPNSTPVPRANPRASTTTNPEILNITLPVNVQDGLPERFFPAKNDRLISSNSLGQSQIDSTLSPQAAIQAPPITESNSHLGSSSHSSHVSPRGISNPLPVDRENIQPTTSFSQPPKQNQKTEFIGREDRSFTSDFQRPEMVNRHSMVPENKSSVQDLQAIVPERQLPHPIQPVRVVNAGNPLDASAEPVVSSTSALTSDQVARQSTKQLPYDPNPLQFETRVSREDQSPISVDQTTPTPSLTPTPSPTPQTEFESLTASTLPIENIGIENVDVGLETELQNPTTLGHKFAEVTNVAGAHRVNSQSAVVETLETIKSVDITNQLVNGIRSIELMNQTETGQSIVKIQLEPAELGSLTVEISKSEAVTKVHITADHLLAHTVLEKSVDLLINSIDVGDNHTVEVDVSHREANREHESQEFNSIGSSSQSENTSTVTETVYESSNENAVNMIV